MERIKSFSEDITTGSEVPESPESNVETPTKSANNELRPFSEGISAGGKLEYSQPFTAFGDLWKVGDEYYKRAIAAAKKVGMSYTDAWDIAWVSYLGQMTPLKQKARPTWVELLQTGWPEIHGKPGSPFKEGTGNTRLLPPDPEHKIGGERAKTSSALREKVGRLKRDLKVSDAHIGWAVYQAMVNAGPYKAGTITSKILQHGWPNLYGPPGAECRHRGQQDLWEPYTVEELAELALHFPYVHGMMEGNKDLSAPEHWNLP